MNRQSVILSAYREAVLDAAEKGVSGQRAASIAIRVASKVSSRVLGVQISVDDVVDALSI